MSPPSYNPNKKTGRCQLKQQRATKTEFAGQPDKRFRADKRKIERIPRQETRKKSQNAADQRNKANQRTFAEPVEVRADAGAAHAHSKPKGQPTKDKIPAHRKNVRLRRKVTRKGIHNPCASDDMIANQPDAQCQENGQHPTRFPPFEKSRKLQRKQNRVRCKTHPNTAPAIQENAASRPSPREFHKRRR